VPVSAVCLLFKDSLSGAKLFPKSYGFIALDNNTTAETSLPYSRTWSFGDY
jgi:hypothetical protein